MFAFQLVLGIVALVVSLSVIVGYFLSVKGYNGPRSDHFDGTTFHNPSGRATNGFAQVWRYFRTRQPDRWPKIKNPFVREEALPAPPVNGIQYTFVNHSTFLLQCQGINLLTDPIWSERCSPMPFAGPARQRPPGLRLESLPKIDLVLLTHNHYDHWDAPTLRQIIKKWNPQFVVPLGLAATLKAYGAQEVVELDWWQAATVCGLTIKALPANHFSSRGLFDRDKTLWAGYSIGTKVHKIYFVGDTGYSDIFKKVGKEEGPFDLAFIPIGAYLPRWFMSPIHTSPEEAVKIHQDIFSRQSVAMHFGTFPLADDGPERAVAELQAALETEGIAASDFLVPEEGHCRQL